MTFFCCFVLKYIQSLFQNHQKNSTELGYLLYISDLDDGNYDAERSSIRALATETGLSGEILMTGELESLGALYEQQGFNAVPSPRQPSPSKMNV